MTEDEGGEEEERIPCLYDADGPHDHHPQQKSPSIKKIRRDGNSDDSDDPTAKAERRRIRNRQSAWRSRQRRMAYVLQLEHGLRVANERIRALEVQLQSHRGGMALEGCILTQAMFEEEVEATDIDGGRYGGMDSMNG